MSIFVNFVESSFNNTVDSPEGYVDKTELISLLNKRINNRKYVCISRPRRFGKSVTASMICNYYSRKTDSKALFNNFKIAKDPSYTKHINKYHTLFINIAEQFSYANYDVKAMMARITRTVASELKEHTPSITFSDESILSFCLTNFYDANHEEQFVIIIDEWDYILRRSSVSKKEIEIYINWLTGFLKNKNYVALTYMTGILPIQKVDESSLNMFDEYSIIEPLAFAPYIGFTEDEVKDLCVKYDISFDDMRFWYDGYHFNNDSLHIYNPNSVMKAIHEKKCSSFWSKTSSFETPKTLIISNIDSIKDDIVKLMEDKRVSCDTSDFIPNALSINTKDRALTLLIHLGYLAIKEVQSSHSFLLKIPNEEIREEFRTLLKNASEFGEIHKLIVQTNNLLEAIWSKDAKTVAEIFNKTHKQYSSIFNFNKEDTLTNVVTRTFALSINSYLPPKREVVAGKGFADLIYLPKPNENVPALLIELKCDKSAKTAIDQIKERDYIDFFNGFHGRVLLVGINYDTDTKEHDCIIEEVLA